MGYPDPCDHEDNVTQHTSPLQYIDASTDHTPLQTRYSTHRWTVHADTATAALSGRRRPGGAGVALGTLTYTNADGQQHDHSDVDAHMCTVNVTSIPSARHTRYLRTSDLSRHCDCRIGPQDTEPALQRRSSVPRCRDSGRRKCRRCRARLRQSSRLRCSAVRMSPRGSTWSVTRRKRLA